MTKLQALYTFFSSFSIPAYEENAIYNPQITPEMPYLTYSASTSAFDKGEVTISCSLWYRTTSLQAIEAKADEIMQKIGLGGYVQQAADGYIWFKQGSVQYMDDPGDDFVKRALINIPAEFITSH